jgi:flagellar biosynthesis GTPase FlhF
MKRSGTVLIYIIVWATVLFASFVIGICVREVRFHRARVAITNKTETTPKAKLTEEKSSKPEQLAQEPSEKAPAEKDNEQLANLPAEQSPEEARGNMRERMANMTEEERAQMRERFGGRRRGGGERFQNLSEEERAQMEERRRQMREQFENMTDEEREAFRAQRRRTGGRRSRGDGEEGGSQPRQNEEEQ